jgi:hypothetical protein
MSFKPFAIDSPRVGDAIVEIRDDDLAYEIELPRLDVVQRVPRNVLVPLATFLDSPDLGVPFIDRLSFSLRLITHPGLWSLSSPSSLSLVAVLNPCLLRQFSERQLHNASVKLITIPSGST